MSSNTDIHVAIIDDEISICRSMSRLLRAAGFWPVSFTSAEDFLEDAAKSGFSCIVLDIQLGGMSGLELHQKLNLSGIATPVIFITAHDAPEIRAQAESAGCAGFFRKTDSGDAVLTAIREAVAASP